jgi:DNA-binding beta-propeller fold protein YncE
MREDELDWQLRMAGQRLRERAELAPVPPLPRRVTALPATRWVRPKARQLLAAAASLVLVAAILGGRLLMAERSQPALAGTHPVAVAYGLGAIWVADSLGAQLLEVDPVQLTVRKRIPVGLDPVDVAVTGDSVWVLCRGDNSLRRYTPDTGTTIKASASLDSVALRTAGTRLLVLSAGNQTLEVHDDTAQASAIHAVILGTRPSVLAANADSAVLASGADLMTAALTDNQPHRLATLPAAITALALTDGGTAVVATADDRLSLVTADGQIRSAAALPAQAVALAVHGQTVWASTADGLIQLRIGGNALTLVHGTQPGATLTDLAAADDGSVVGIAGEPPVLIHQLEQPTSNDPLQLAPWAAPFATAAIRTGASPEFMIDVDGAVWVSTQDGGTLDRIDPATNSVTDSLGIDGLLQRPVYMFGSIWVLGYGDIGFGQGLLGRVDPTTRTVTGIVPCNCTGGRGNGGGTLGQFGNMLVASLDSTVTLYDPATMKPIRSATILGDHLDDLMGRAVVGGDTWMLSPQYGKIYRVSLDTLTVTLSIELPVAAIEYLNGRLLAMTDTGLLEQIDPDNGRVIASWQLAAPDKQGNNPLTSDGVPAMGWLGGSGVDIFDDGTGNGVWVNQVSTELTHLDLVTGQTRTVKGLPYQPDVNPGVLIAADGTMWVTDWKDSLIFHMKP